MMWLKGNKNIIFQGLEKKGARFLAEHYDKAILLGIRGSEDLLSRALEKYGSKTMAVYYLNNGNQKLAKAAEEWGRLHGYTVISRVTQKRTHSSWGRWQ